jgi:diguanylate cyclase (GGDEF)-like protein
MRFKSLAMQVLQQIMLYAVLCWLLVSLLRAGVMFYQGQQGQQQIPATVSSLYIPLLAQSIGKHDNAEILTELATINALPGVDSLSLVTRSGQRLHYGRPEQNGERNHVYPLDVHPARQPGLSLATLTLSVSNTPIRRAITNDLISSMMQRVLDFAALTVLIVFVLRRRFVQPVEELARAVRAFKPGEHSAPFRLHQYPGIRDEMTQLLESFIAMRSSINKHLAERQRYEAELTQARDQLAARVDARTGKLNQLLHFQTLISLISSRFINIPLGEIDGAMNETLAQIGTYMQVDRCYLIGVDQGLAVNMVHEWSAEGITAGTSGLEFAPLASRPSLFATLLRDGVLNLPHCQTLSSFAPALPPSDVKSVLLIRIDYLGRPVGIFGCDMVREERQWQDEELVQTRLLGEMFANMIMRCQQLQELHETQLQLQQANAHLARMALSDSLTGIANRRHFDEEKHHVFGRARRKGEAFSLLFMDIDFFKEFNDHYGHQAGDQCLRQLAQALQTLFIYPGELPARIGGEEFAVLLPGMGPEAALQRAEQLRQAICDLNIPHEHSRVAPFVTISQGVASLSHSRHQSVDQMIAEADAALYRAKATGRNSIG